MKGKRLSGRRPKSGFGPAPTLQAQLVEIQIRDSCRIKCTRPKNPFLNLSQASLGQLRRSQQRWVLREAMSPRSTHGLKHLGLLLSCGWSGGLVLSILWSVAEAFGILKAPGIENRQE